MKLLYANTDDNPISSLYVELFSKWETLYYNGFISDEEYTSNPFPL